MKSDVLIEIFYKHLNKNNMATDNIDEFVHNVVADYMFYLMNIGHIPESLFDPLEIDLKEEVLELYHKLMERPSKKAKYSSSELPPAKVRRLN